MADRPIIFSAPMIRALLEGPKTQTRRTLNPQPYSFMTEGQRYWNASGVIGGRICINERELLNLHKKPKQNDRLWVREAWRAEARLDKKTPRDIATNYPGIKYLATDEPDSFGIEGRVRASMHMPRWASRLTLIVTDVRVERLQDISESDAVAEGCFKGKASGRVFSNSAAMHLGGDEWSNARDWYADLWDGINGLGAWESNPWVAA